MTTGYIGSPTGNTIVPVSNFTKQTKEIALTVTSAQAGWATTRAVGIFYADSLGNWRLRFNIKGTFTSAVLTTIVASIGGVAFKSGFTQSISGWWGAGFFQDAYASGATGTIALDMPNSSGGGVTVSYVYFSGDVELDSEPTTYTIAANMEGNVNVAAYFPPASGATAGLVDGNAATWNGVKTFASAPLTDSIGEKTATNGVQILGRTSGTAIAAGYVGEKVNWNNPATQTLTTSYVDWTNAYITLSAGVWLVLANVSMVYYTAASSGAQGNAAAIITDSSNNIISICDKSISTTAAAATSVRIIGVLPFSFVSSVNSTTVYKIRIAKADRVGVGSGLGFNELNVFSDFFAVRIA